MADTFVPVSEDTAGTLHKIDTGSIVVNSETVERQRVVMGSPTDGTSDGLAGVRTKRMDTADVFTAGEVLADQTGAGAVLTFTFANPMQQIWVTCSGGIVRVDPFGGTPSVSAGIPVADGAMVPFIIQATVVKVYAPTSVVVSVWGYRYS